MGYLHYFTFVCFLISVDIVIMKFGFSHIALALNYTESNKI